MTKMRLPKLGSIAALSVAMVFILTGCGPEYIVFHPAGPVGKMELHLIILSAILVAIVIVPVLILLAIIVYRYRDKPNNNAPYQPNWTHSRTLEIIWWGIPVIIIAILGAFTAKTTFALTKPPENNVQPITVDVTSLDWKWLFQYPGQNVATVNYCVIPQGVPVQFVLTADAPMNSFWVPRLGGQEYTMPGMAMHLWLQADEPGTFQGYGANFTGSGFSHMNFSVVSKSQAEFQQWVTQAKQSSNPLTEAGYKKLAQPSVVGQVSYSSYPPGLFDEVVKQNGSGSMNSMPGMDASNPSTAMTSPKGSSNSTTRSTTMDMSSSDSMGSMNTMNSTSNTN